MSSLKGIKLEVCIVRWLLYFWKPETVAQMINLSDIKVELFCLNRGWGLEPYLSACLCPRFSGILWESRMSSSLSMYIGKVVYLLAADPELEIRSPDSKIHCFLWGCNTGGDKSRLIVVRMENNIIINK